MSLDNCFETARSVSGYPSWTKFDQSAAIQGQIQQNQLGNVAAGGLCGGVSALFLGLLKSGGGFFNLVGNNPNALWQYINRGHQLLQFPTMEQCDFASMGGAVGLNMHAKSIKFACPVTASLGNWVRDNPGYYLVGCPNHYCAAANSAGGVSFFDPNTGEASFGAGGGPNLSTFMEKYFNMGEVARLYMLQAPNVVYLTWYK